MSWRSRLPEHVVACIDDLTERLGDALGDDLVGLWFHGAVAFPGSEDSITDIDFHAVVANALGAEARDGVRSAFAAMPERHGWLGDELDGHVVHADEAREPQPPRSLLTEDDHDRSWPLHRAHFHADRVIVTRGPHPRTIVPEPRWDEIEPQLVAELDEAIKEWPDTPYTVLQTCRVLLSLEHRDAVVSKIRAGAWALRVLPAEWRDLIRAAQRHYRQRATDDDDALVREKAARFAIWARTNL